MKTTSWACLVVGFLLWLPGTLPALDPSGGMGFALDNGDINGDMERDLSDAVGLLGHLYLGAPGPVPLALCGSSDPAVENGDTNGDGDRDVSDAVLLLGWLFAGGRAPADACFEGEGGAPNDNPRIIPPQASAFGRTFGEWTAAWWQWAAALPASAHPLFDSAACDAGQSGQVWYLGGAFTGTATTRQCAVPAGKAILFPIANVECSTIEPPPFYGANEDELRACAAAFQDTATGLVATIDGQELQNLDRYRVQSPLFPISLPADNIFGLPGPVSGESVSDGVWLLLAPLAAGIHTIHFESFPGFPIIVTYEITVE
jgi:hypothetical protein